MSIHSALVGTVGKSIFASDSALGNNNAGFHNSLFRGKNLGTAVTATQWAEITAGTFNDMYIGDYWLINGVKWRIAAFDYWLYCGDAECTTHHIVIVPDTNLLEADGSTTHWMNSSDTTAGAYYGSDFRSALNGNTGLATCRSLVNAAFGSAHILSHKEYLKNAVTNGYESAGAWYGSDVEIMTEQMVYGGKVFGNVTCGTNIPTAHTINKTQLPLFALAPEFICNRASWWLRDVVSSANFALVYDNGNCLSSNASLAWVGVRPAFGIC